MSRPLANFAIPLTVCALALLAAAVAVIEPDYLTSSSDLAALIFLQIVAVATWKFREMYFPLLLLTFLLAGLDVPFASAFTTARWAVLGVGSLVGFAIYMRDSRHHFTGFHLTAGFCVLAAFASVIVSSHPTVALLKTASLMLLFLYCTAGGRLALLGREEVFFSSLLLGCELMTYVAGLCYLVFHVEVFGNPNSLGAIMGIVVVPLLLWGVSATAAGGKRLRLTAALCLSVLLLLSSFARAGITAAAVAFFFLCFGLRRYRLLLKGMACAAMIAVLVFTVMPPPPDTDQPATIISAFVYKGKLEKGVLGSRRTAWERTTAVIRDNPWFGSGFGTSVTSSEQQAPLAALASDPDATREHGNSYLAILEWAGLLGVLPFFALTLLNGRNVLRVFLWMRRTLDPRCPALPLAMVVAAGLAHAAFEDWLFAVGYYIAPLFWVLAFACVDFLPAAEEQPAFSCVPAAATSWLEPANVPEPVS